MLISRPYANEGAPVLGTRRGRHQQVLSTFQAWQIHTKKKRKYMIPLLHYLYNRIVDVKLRIQGAHRYMWNSLCLQRVKLRNCSVENKTVQGQCATSCLKYKLEEKITYEIIIGKHRCSRLNGWAFREVSWTHCDLIEYTTSVWW